MAGDLYIVNDGSTQINQLTKALRAIDPELRKSFVRNLKNLARPVETSIKQHIPQVAPLSGFNNNGRLGWGVGVAVDTTKVRFKATGSKSTSVTPLLSVAAMSPAISLVDMAGRGGSGNTASGRAMIRKLNSVRNASRYVYPGGESAQSEVIRQIEDVIDEAAKIVMRGYA